MRRTPLGRKTPLRSSSGLRRQSTRRRAQQAARRALAAPLGQQPCALKVPNVCTGRAEHWHELVGAGQGGSKVDPRNLSPACDRCNGWVEDFPAAARRYRWKVPRWEAQPGVGGLVPAVPVPWSLAQLEGDPT